MKTILLIIFFLNTYFISAQTFETSYTKSTSSTNCGEEAMIFKFQNNFLYKTDNYYQTTERIPSRLEKTGFDNYGYFYEHWDATYYLNEYGIDEFRRIKSYAYRLVFDRKGGNLLYIFEIQNQSGDGRFYFTRAGYNIYCGK